MINKTSAPTRRRCPDCTAEAADQLLQHDRTCPLGRALDQVKVADRMWFRRHPGRTSRRRASSWAEREHALLLGVPAAVAGATDVLVQQPLPGVLVRIGIVNQ